MGPNAVLQLAAALRAEGGDALAAEVFGAAGQSWLLEVPPTLMVDEAVPAALSDALWEVYPHGAAKVAAEAGRRTADYVVANRIPDVAKRLLRVLPDWLAARLLLTAIRKNAWTFAGSGTCAVAVPGEALVLDDNPMPMPGAIWHRAVIGRMVASLLHPATRLDHVTCLHSDTRACFAVRPPGSDGAAPCVKCRMRR
ncbi:MAG: bacteriochlorophyll 4-vinyl reductase [Pseudomonadota bacterium]